MTGHNPLTLNIAPYSKPSEADPKAWGDNGEWLRRLPPTPVTLDALVLRERARLGSGEAGPPGGTSAQSQARLGSGEAGPPGGHPSKKQHPGGSSVLTSLCWRDFLRQTSLGSAGVFFGPFWWVSEAPVSDQANMKLTTYVVSYGGITFKVPAYKNFKKLSAWSPLYFDRVERASTQDKADALAATLLAADTGAAEAAPGGVPAPAVLRDAAPIHVRRRPCRQPTLSWGSGSRGEGAAHHVLAVGLAHITRLRAPMGERAGGH